MTGCCFMSVSLKNVKSLLQRARFASKLASSFCHFLFFSPNARLWAILLMANLVILIAD